MATRNRSAFLSQCLGSILAQTRRPDLVVVSDDGSTDATQDVVAEWTRRMTEAGVRVKSYRRVRPLGQEANRRFALSEVDTDYVAMLDDDDFWYVRCLERLADALDAHPAATFAAGDQDTVAEDGSVRGELSRETRVRTGRAFLPTGLLHDWLWMQVATCPFGIQATLFRRSALAEIGFVPQGSDIIPDYAIFTALALRGGDGYYVAETLGAYRTHARGRASDQDMLLGRELRDWTVRALEAARRPEDRRVLRKALAYRQRDHIMNLAHAARGRRAVAEYARLVRECGWREAANRRMAFLFPLALLGADRLRHGRGKQRVVPFHGFSPDDRGSQPT